VTLFFVSLGLKIPEPSGRLLALAALVAVFVVASRFLAIFPIFALLRLDSRTAGVVALNIPQITEFPLVLATPGTGPHHVSADVGSLVLYAVLLTAVLATYGILFNHTLATALANGLAAVGLFAGSGAPGGGAAAAEREPEERDLFLLGVSREGLAFLEH